MKKVFLVVCAFLLIFSSCSKGDGDSNDNPLGSSENLIADFQGSMITDHFENEIIGNITVSETGIFSLLSFGGSIIGDAELTDNSYTLTNLVGDGAFESSTFNEGQLNINDSVLTINGNLIDSSTLVINGEFILATLPRNQEWRDARAKSSVFFTHSERCYASIVIYASVTAIYEFENLGPYIGQDGDSWCDEPHASFYNENYYRDVDNVQTKQVGSSELVVDPGTGALAIRDIYFLNWFILDKNREYTYDVRWGNGDESTGSFTTADGGGAITICPTSDEADCDIGGNSLCSDFIEDEIFEDYVVVDYASSNTDELGGFVLSNNSSGFGDLSATSIRIGDIDVGSYIWIYTNQLIEEKTYQLVDGNQFLSVRLTAHGPIYDHGSFTGGSVEVLRVDWCTTQGFEIDMVFNNVTLSSGANYINFSGPLKIRSDGN